MDSDWRLKAAHGAAGGEPNSVVAAGERWIAAGSMVTGKNLVTGHNEGVKYLTRRKTSHFRFGDGSTHGVSDGFVVTRRACGGWLIGIVSHALAWLAHDEGWLSNGVASCLLVRGTRVANRGIGFSVWPEVADQEGSSDGGARKAASSRLVGQLQAMRQQAYHIQAVAPSLEVSRGMVCGQRQQRDHGRKGALAITFSRLCFSQCTMKSSIADLWVMKYR
ncbi:hypothetical protein NL676_007349 [Syzygium grande]|nr:hypothetical protein NL676_007349 [Syzygium grande]